MVLHNSKFVADLAEPRPVLYLVNQHAISSREIITSLTEAGVTDSFRCGS
jgi:hypothetical protein